MKKLKDPMLSSAGYNVTSEMVEKLGTDRQLYLSEKNMIENDIEVLKKSYLTKELAAKVKNIN